MKNLEVEIKSNGPMLMHCDLFSNPLHPLTKAHKELTSQRKKTDEILTAIAKSEFISSCYYNERDGMHMPTQNIRKCLIEGARFNKLGKHIERGVVFLNNSYKLKYKGPQTPEDLWTDGTFTDARSVVINRARLMRYRPIFHEWTVDGVSMMFNPDVINKEEILNALINAGNMCGLCDNRPLFGKFTITEV